MVGVVVDYIMLVVRHVYTHMHVHTHTGILHPPNTHHNHEALWPADLLPRVQ